MKKQVSPVVAAIVIVVVIAIAALVWNYFAGGRTAGVGEDEDETRFQLRTPTAEEIAREAPKSEAMVREAQEEARAATARVEAERRGAAPGGGDE